MNEVFFGDYIIDHGMCERRKRDAEINKEESQRSEKWIFDIAKTAIRRSG
jgi:hypothetical protein